MGKPLTGNRPKGWVDGANSVSQVDEVSDMVLACQLCRGGLVKVASASTSVWEKAVPQLSL